MSYRVEVKHPGSDWDDWVASVYPRDDNWGKFGTVKAATKWGAKRKASRFIKRLERKETYYV